jgi:hypothetical protein
LATGATSMAATLSWSGALAPHVSETTSDTA